MWWCAAARTDAIRRSRRSRSMPAPACTSMVAAHGRSQREAALTFRDFFQGGASYYGVSCSTRYDDFVRLLDGSKQDAKNCSNYDCGRAVGPCRDKPDRCGDPDCERRADCGQRGRDRIRPKPASALRLHQILTPLECCITLLKPKPCGRNRTIVRSADQGGYSWSGCSRCRGIRNRTDTMGRSRLGGCPKLHCGIHQLSKPPAEDAGVRALEERRLLHCLDLDKVLNELSTLGGDALAIRGRIEQHCCKPVLPTRKRKDQGDKLRTKFAYEYQAAD